MSARHAPIDCDVLVIGSGAGGSVAARALASAGREVTVLEEGPRVGVDEIAAGTQAENMRRLYRHGGLTPIFGRPMVAYGEGRCVGGTTMVNGGLLWAPPEALLDRWADRSGIGGYRAGDLAGHLGAIASRLGAGFQHDGEGNRDSTLLADGADRLGWHWQFARRAVRDCRHSNRCTTGCPRGAKQNMAETYLADAELLSARVVPDQRVVRLEHDRGRVHAVHVAGAGDRRRRTYRPREVFLAAGPIGSAALLQRSSIQPQSAGREMAFHVNLRTVARFPDRVDAARGTIFTRQVNQFTADGVLIMPSNVSAGGLGAAVAAAPPALVDGLLADIDRLGVYTTQVRVRGTARIRTGPLGVTLRHSLSAEDGTALRTAFRNTARVLFAAGAEQLHPPLPGSRPLGSLDEVDAMLAGTRIGDWELISVHGMASCRMGRPERGGVCDDRGRPYGMANLRVCDASVLPGLTGISPQGTIMAFSQEVADRFISDSH